jgi:hypothetical protein
MIDKAELAGKTDSEICEALVQICEDLNSVIEVCAIGGIDVDLKVIDVTSVAHAARCRRFDPVAVKLLVGHGLDV